VALPSERSQIADRRGVYAFAPLKLRNYWTEVHQILHNVARLGESFEIGIAIFHSVYERQGDK